MRILCIDPGKVSGAAILDFDKEAGTVVVAHSDELDEYETGDYVNAVLTDARANGINLKVVCEDFIVTTQTGKNTRADWSLHLIGAIRWLCHAHGYHQPVLQKPVEAKNFCPNDRLKALGIWHIGGEGHAKDALRHGVLYAVKVQKWHPAGLLG